MGNCLLIHHAGHFDLVPPVIRHLQITHEYRIGDGFLSETAADFLDCILDLFSGGSLLVVKKQRELLRLAFRHKFNRPDADRTDIVVPSVLVLEGSESGGSNLAWELRGKRQLALEL